MIDRSAMMGYWDEMAFYRRFRMFAQHTAFHDAMLREERCLRSLCGLCWLHRMCALTTLRRVETRKTSINDYHELIMPCGLCVVSWQQQQNLHGLLRHGIDRVALLID